MSVSPPEERGKDLTDGARFGAAAPASIRIALLAAWLSLVARLLSTSLPGSRTGIPVLIQRADTVSSVLSQSVALIGSSQLVLLVVHTLSERTLRPLYRILVTPPSGVVLLLVMLSSTTPLEPQASLALGAACLAIALGGATVSLGSRAGRAHGLVLAAVALGAALRLGVRALEAIPHLDLAVQARLPLLAGASRFMDLLGVSLAAVRFIAERRVTALFLVLTGLLASTVLTWGALRGSYDGAALWQVLASRALAELAGTGGLGGATGNHAVDAFALLFAAVVACFPGRVSWGLASVAFALLSRPGVDVPAGALVLALSGLMSPMTRQEPARPRASRAPAKHDLASPAARGA